MLESVSWHGLPEADAEAAHAVAQVEAKAGGAEVLTQLALAREAVVAAVRKHTSALGLVTQGNDARVLLLELRTAQPIERVEVAVVQPKSGLATWQAVGWALVMLVDLSRATASSPSTGRSTSSPANA